MKVSKAIFLLILGLTSSWAVWGQRPIKFSPQHLKMAESLFQMRGETVPTRGTGIEALYVDDTLAVFILRPGNGDGRYLVARKGDPVTANLNRAEGYVTEPRFGFGEDLGNGNFVLDETTDINYFDTVYLDAGTKYHFESWEYAIVDGKYFYTDVGYPSMTAIEDFKTPSKKSLLFNKDTVITSSYFEFYPQFGAADNVLMDPNKPQRMLTVFPENSDGKINISFSRFGMSEDHHFFVYDGDSTNDNLIATKADIVAGTVLTATNAQGSLTVSFEFTGTDYFEYMGYGAWIAEVYETGNATSGPSLPVSNFRFDSIGVNDAAFHWDPGNEDGVLVLMSQNPISVTPQSGVAYAADTVFGQGEDLGGGVYAMSFEPGSGLQVSGLVDEGTYYVKVFGYLEDGNGDRYFNPEGALTGDFNYVSGVVWNQRIRYQNLTDRSVTINWDPGDADGTLVTYGLDVEVQDNVYYDSTSLPPYPEQINARISHYWQLGTDTTLIVSPLAKGGSLEYLQVHPFKVSEFGINYGPSASLAGVETLSITPPREPGVITVVNTSYGEIDMWIDRRVILVAARDTIPALAQLTNTTNSNLKFGTVRSAEYPRTSILWRPGEFQDGIDTLTVTGLEPGTEYIFAGITYNYDPFKDFTVYYAGEEGYDTLKTLNDILTVTWEGATTPEVWCAGENFQVQYRKNVAAFSNRELRLEVQGQDGTYDTLPKEVFSSILSDGALNFTGRVTVPDLPTDTYNFRWWLTGKDDSTYSAAYPVELIFIEQPEITTSGTTLASSVAGDSVQWFFNEEYSASGTSLPNGNRAGIYSVRVYQDGCYRDSEPLVVTGLEDEFSVAGLVAYPNPTSGELRMQLPSAIGDQRVTVTVLTPQGRTALKATNHPASAPLRVDHLRTGMYYLHVEGEQYHSSTAFYKE